MKKSFLILSLLALTLIACPPPDPEPQPEPEKPTLSKIDITDAAALFVEPSGTDAGKIFKIKKDLTTIEEVKYTNTDGSSADMGNLKASYVINAHNDYAIIGFAADPDKAKTYDFELVADKAYLVRKSDGKVFSLDNTPSCAYVIPAGDKIYYPSGQITSDYTAYESGYWQEYFFWGDKLMQITPSGNTVTQKNILPINIAKINIFNADKNNNVFLLSDKEGLIYNPQDGLLYDHYSDWSLFNTLIFGGFYNYSTDLIFFNNETNTVDYFTFSGVDSINIPITCEIVMSHQWNDKQIIIYDSKEAQTADYENNVFIFSKSDSTKTMNITTDSSFKPYAENELVYIPRDELSSSQSACTSYNLKTEISDPNNYFKRKSESFVLYNGTVISAEHDDRFQYIRQGGSSNGADLRIKEATGIPVMLVGTGTPVYYSKPSMREGRK